MPIPPLTDSHKRMTNHIRVQLYLLDQGMYYKHCIQYISRETMDELNQGSRYRAVELAPEDWYGERLPRAIRP